MENPRINIYGDIGGESEDSVTIAKVNAQLEAIGSPEWIDVYITSNGGSVIQGIAIAKTLEEHPAKIRTIVRGGALSIAGYIACVGDERIIEEDSVLHIHGPNYTVEGGMLEDFEDAVEQLSKMKDSMARRYSVITGKSPEEIKKDFERDRFYSPEECVTLGYMTQVKESSGTIAAFIDTEKFQIPARLGAALARRKESPKPTEKDEMSKNPATPKELKAKFPGASADFILSQTLSDASMEDATAAYVDELEAKVKKLEAKAAKAMEDEETVAMEDEEESTAMEDIVDAVFAKVKAMMEEEDEEEAVAMEDEEEEEEAVAMQDDNGIPEETVAKLIEKAVAKAIGGQKKAASASSRTRLGTKAIRKPTMTPRQAATQSAKAEVDKLASAKAQESGVKKHQAVAAVLKENPKLRERMLAEANG